MAREQNETLTHLGEMSVETFLKDYWQKKPLLIRAAIPDLPELDADEIAGYALDEDVESRILIETPNISNPLKSQWKMLLGPQKKQTFSTLPETHWTLLVQAVDQLNPIIHKLLHKFRFIPNWRVDDIMVSFATDQGGVGPHFDYYDVFLLQATGSRLWKLGTKCDANTKLRSDTDCKILTEFEATEEWIVNPGDLLYIPPQIPHWGVAQGECITYSVGFRAPSHSEILLDYTQELASFTTEDHRYSDENICARSEPGEILPEDIDRLKNILQTMISDDKKLAHWFGRYMTEAKRNAPIFESHGDNALPQLAANCRAAYIQSKLDPTLTDLFVNGDQYESSVEFAKAICSYQEIDITQFPNDQFLIDELLDNEILV